MINILLHQDLTTENFDARVAQANLASKNNIANFIRNGDFDDKLKILNKLSKNVTLLSTKYFSFFPDKMYFTAMMNIKICLFINQHLTC